MIAHSTSAMCEVKKGPVNMGLSRQCREKHKQYGFIFDIHISGKEREIREANEGEI